MKETETHEVSRRRRPASGSGGTAQSADMSLQGKVALVTGGAQGIGRAMVQSLLEEGASVMICDRQRGPVEESVKELEHSFPGKCDFVICDVTDSRQLEDCFKRTLERFGGLNIVVNNAGTVNEHDPAWRDVINLNLVSVIVSTQLGLRYMGKDRGGRGGVVVNVGSTAAYEVYPTFPVYNSTKAAVCHYSRSVGTDLYFNQTGVKVMSISPGGTSTQLVNNIVDKLVQEPYILQAYHQLMDNTVMQSARNVGRGLIHILKKGENGSGWIVMDDKPPVLKVWGGL